MNEYEKDFLKKLVEKHGKRKVLDFVYLQGEDYKVCPVCKQMLHESKYYIRRDGQLSGYCIKCSKKINNRKTR